LEVSAFWTSALFGRQRFLPFYGDTQLLQHLRREFATPAHLRVLNVPAKALLGGWSRRHPVFLVPRNVDHSS
jgi:hypothetical protein